MKIVVDDKHAFVHLKGNSFLCVGPKREVLRANPIALAEMVKQAVAVSAYNEITNTGQATVH